jgi:hypothetical protein
MTGRFNSEAKTPLHEHSSDYLFNMSALTRKQARQQWRQSIKTAWDNRCAYCGRPPIDDSSLTIDHIKPKCKGGEDRTSNVIPACWSCNTEKGSSDWMAWYRMQPFYSIYGEWRIRRWLQTGEANTLDNGTEDARYIEDYYNMLQPGVS